MEINIRALIVGIIATLVILPAAWFFSFVSVMAACGENNRFCSWGIFGVIYVLAIALIVFLIHLNTKKKK